MRGGGRGWGWSEKLCLPSHTFGETVALLNLGDTPFVHPPPEAGYLPVATTVTEETVVLLRGAPELLHVARDGPENA